MSWLISRCPSELDGLNNVQNYKQLLKQFEGKILPKSHPSTVAVQRVGSRIFKAASIFAKQYNLHYFDTKNVTFTVVESEQANAFVLPGNHVFGELVPLGSAIELRCES